MSETVPDPATRDHALASLNEIARVFGLITGDEVLVITRPVDAGISAAPPIPIEPPNGTVLLGRDTDLWQRDDIGAEDYGGEHDRWWLMGQHDAFSWEEALNRGADPSRRLVELPDPDDGAAMEAVRSLVRGLSREWDPSPYLVTWVVRALAERGPA